MLPVSSTQTPKVRVLAWVGVHCEARQCKVAMAVMVQVLSIIFFPPFFCSLSLSLFFFSSSFFFYTYMYGWRMLFIWIGATTKNNNVFS